MKIRRIKNDPNFIKFMSSKGIDYERDIKCKKSIREITENFAMKIFGFEELKKFGEASSSRKFICGTQTPLLNINSKMDIISE